jgi:cytochrome b561
MTWKNTAARWGGLSIGLHWLMLALLVGVYACIELKGYFPKDSAPRELLKQWHFMLGLSVFALVWLRLLARVIGPTPTASPPPPALQEKAAKLMFVALYALMIGMPLAGWMILSAAGKPVPFFGLELTPLIGKDPALAKQIKEWHELAGTIGYWLIGIHAAAALYHHYVVRDNMLTIMLPAKK